jgi:hypothetical protein
MSSLSRAIIHISTSGKSFSKVNYSRRMYAVIRRYTPDVAEGGVNECYAELTGLRTFFKMTYKELANKILGDLAKEIGVSFTIRVDSVTAYEEAKNKSKRSKSISTYKELNRLFASLSLEKSKYKKGVSVGKKKLAIPFLGKVF